MSNFIKPVAVKYNGNQLDTLNKCLSYDYIVLNYQGKPNYENLPQHIKVEHLEYGTKVFQNVSNLLIDNERFATLTYNPRNINLGENLVQIKLENHLLYNYELQEIKRILEAIIKIIGLKFSGVSRLDVCADFENSTQYFTTLINDIISQKILIGGRPKKLALYTNHLSAYGQTKNGLLTYSGFAFGKKSSSKYLRIYNKSLEMETVKYKHHIANYWYNNNFETLSDVWRFEYSLNSEFMRENQVNYNHIWDNDYIVTLLKTAINGHFELKQRTGKTELNKENTLYFFDFNYKNTIIRVLKKCKIIKETIQKSLVSIKRQIKSLYRSFYSTNEQSFYNAMYCHLRNYHLIEWFNWKESQYLMEFNKQTLILKNI